MTFDKILKEVRTELNITQERPARDMNVSVATITRWENGHNTPSRLARMRIRDICVWKGVTSEIFSEIEKSI
jgi:DNA-binding transcriptional regulator YiaG